MARSIPSFNERHIIFIVSRKFNIETGGLKDFQIEKKLGEYLSSHGTIDPPLEDVLQGVLNEKALTAEEFNEVYGRQLDYLKGLATKFPAKSTSP